MTKGDLATTIVTSFAAAGNWCLWLSQAPLVWQMIREGDAAAYSWLPSLTLVGTMSLWSGYTVFTLNDPSVHAANWSGVGIPLIYLCIFVAYSKTARARARIVGATTLVLALAWSFILGVYLGRPSLADPGRVAGAVIATVNITFFISPLAALYRGVRARDLSHVSRLLSMVQLVQSSLWVAAAVMLPDTFVLLVNAIGLGFASVQLSVIAAVGAMQRHDAAAAAAAAVQAGALPAAEGKIAPAAGDAADGSGAAAGGATTVVVVDGARASEGKSAPPALLISGSASSTALLETRAAQRAAGGR